MSIYLGQLLPNTYEGLERLTLDLDWTELRKYMEPTDVAWLAVRLEFEEDNYLYFPSGKWATIQRLQDMVRDYAKLLHENK